MSEELYVCGVTEHLGAREGRWGLQDLTWTIAEPIPSIGFNEQQRLTKLVFDHLESFCGLRFHYVTDDSRANLIFLAARGRRNQLDGPGGTLAYAQLPWGDNYRGQLRLTFDIEEFWKLAVAPPQNPGGILYFNVCYHEVGHTLGLTHTTKFRRQLMNPTYAYDVAYPQDNDRSRIISRYPQRPGTLPQPKPVPIPDIDDADDFQRRLLNLFGNRDLAEKLLPKLMGNLFPQLKLEVALLLNDQIVQRFPINKAFDIKKLEALSEE